MTKLAKRIGSAVLAVGLVCGCILPASAAEAEEEPRVLQYETAEPVSSVVVDTRWTEVVIQPGQTDKITVESAADAKGEYSYDCTVADGVLTVNVEGIEGEESKGYIQIGPFRFLNQYAITLDNTITVTLPNKMYDSIQVKADHDDIRMRDIQSQTAQLTTEHGDIVLSGAQPQALNVENDHGDIVFDHAAVIRCEGKTSHGNIHGTIAGSKSSYTTSVANAHSINNLRTQIGDGVHALIFNIEHGNVGVYFTA